MTNTILSSISCFFAQTQAAGGPTSILGHPAVMMILMFVMLYFLMIRPQQKQRREHAARMEAIQSGDKVVTSAGIHGLVHNVKEHTIVVKVAEGTMIEFDKAAITVLHKKDAAK